MIPDLQAYAAFCEWAPTHWLVVSDNVFDPLIYYSHLVPVLLSLPLALIIYWNNRQERLSQYFFLIILLFSIWSFGDLILWANDDPATIMFVWAVLILIEPVIYLSAYLFSHTLLSKKPFPVITLSALILLILPITLFTSTSVTIQHFNLTNCWREVIEGPIVYYSYFVQVIIGLVILGKTAIYWKQGQVSAKEKTKATFAITAVLLFLAIFSLGNIVGSYFEDWTVGQYGIFGMPVMTIIIGIMMPRYRIFRTNLFAAQLLVAALAILTFSVIFAQNLSTVRLVAIVTFMLVLALGTLLVKSIKREINQKQVAQKLATELAGVNLRLERLDKTKSEFLSIASHQLRSPLTSIRGYVSMILEGSYGTVDPKIKEVLEHVSTSAQNMALSVDDYLNVSRIEAGNMKYDIADVDLRKLVEDLVMEMQPVAESHHNTLRFRSLFDGAAMVKLDFGKTRQIVQNLVDNAIKYTPDNGAISVTVRRDQSGKMIFVDVTDTGIGISSENLQNLFAKFERAKNANSANVSGTGLGLYIARQMARAMRGDVTAFSEGEGKGSTFTISFPQNGIAPAWSTGKTK